MTHDEAMAHIHRNGTRTVTRAGLRIAWRFGHPVYLAGGPQNCAYTPTREDMQATDWQPGESTARAGSEDQ
jgi:hypothetical protein